VTCPIVKVRVTDGRRKTEMPGSSGSDTIARYNPEAFLAVDFRVWMVGEAGEATDL
jgi:hypothetical protein